MVIIMKKALFWDFDGTLVQSDKKWTDSLHTALERLDYDIDIEDIRQHLRKGYTWAHPEISYTESIGQKWWDKLFVHLDSFYESRMVSKRDGEKASAWFKKQILDHENYSLYDDAAEVLKKCGEMGFKNYILSNNFPELPNVIKELKLAEYFAGYAVSANIGYEKPRIEMFQYALDIAGFPDCCYMIGDNPTADIQGGKEAGMKTVLVHREGDFEADYKCASLSEIPVLLTSMRNIYGYDTIKAMQSAEA